MCNHANITLIYIPSNARPVVVIQNFCRFFGWGLMLQGYNFQPLLKPENLMEQPDLIVA